MGRYKKNLGDFGEDMAQMYLTKNGYNVIHRNYLVKGGEIDIVAKEGKALVFVEVKTRSSENFGFPAEAVDYKKIGHMRHAAEEYIRKFPTEAEIRFDIVEVYATINDGIAQLSKINHIKDIIVG